MDVFSNNIAKMDMSSIKVDLGTVPDDVSSIKEIIGKMQAYDSRQESLLEQIAGCVTFAITGLGFTLITTVNVLPAQPLALGVTV